MNKLRIAASKKEVKELIGIQNLLPSENSKGCAMRFQIKERIQWTEVIRRGLREGNKLF